ncbi:alkylphosphonate utilization protein [Campylobacter geochelonis]|uniref:Protein phnA n=1 Tax=Campylobacter geochelonis TaxID=1780362 RepID=A0A128EEQ5_9BACT|nr:alkylphosphonate utilization protein [Campylobacter geochelonis]QKF71847.1 PhnA domain-containing protein [Campylobacter geochelonis]CZE47008.1 Protein phnA [Campylobacter geochelonis]CZE47410.1 Protein phnA [Campylobacter geochelonis]CZE50953.1 Protein phnA [Campylobacter geochelonis]
MPKDANSNELNAGDSISVIKDLKLKGTSGIIKQGTKAKSIKLTSKDDEIECRLDKYGVVVLKTCFVKKI